jgi:hypothetical protein
MADDRLPRTENRLTMSEIRVPLRSPKPVSVPVPVPVPVPVAVAAYRDKATPSQWPGAALVDGYRFRCLTNLYKVATIMSYNE